MIGRSALLLACLGGSIHSASFPLDLHVGTTLDWVRRSGPSGEAKRFRLEFLADSSSHLRSVDSAALYQSSTTGTFSRAVVVQEEWIEDWTVLVTSPDSTQLSDTATLRVHDASRWSEDPDFPSIALHNSTYWIRPSANFPIDLLENSPADAENMRLFHEGSDHSGPAMTGATEFAYALWPTEELGSPRMSGLWTSVHRTTDALCFYQIEAVCSTAPVVGSRSHSGIVSWMSRGALWELEAVDGLPRPTTEGRSDRETRTGESWIYRDSSLLRDHGVQAEPTGTVYLETKQVLSDSSGWRRVDIAVRHRSAAGIDSIGALELRIDAANLLVRVDSTLLGPWLLDDPNSNLSMTELWALGWLSNTSYPDDTAWSYRVVRRWSNGEINGRAQGARTELDLAREVVATRIRRTSYDSSFGSDWNTGREDGREWSLVAHSFEPSILGTSRDPRSLHPDLESLVDRLGRNPDLELHRIAVDGSRESARGRTGLELLTRRGLGFLVWHEGNRLVTLRIQNP